MINTRNIILIASITAVLGFGSVALQTNTITVYALMDNTSEFLDFGEKSEITTLGKPTGEKGGKKSALEGEGTSGDGNTTVKCSATNILKSTIKNSGEGIISVSLGAYEETYLWPCDNKIVKYGASIASLNTRSNDNPDYSNYTSSVNYQVDATLVSSTSLACFTVSTGPTSLIIDLCPVKA